MFNKPLQTRRAFLRSAVQTGTAFSLFHAIPASALGRGGHVAPSNRIVLGCIGMGGQGSSNMRAFLGQPDTQIVAVCDVDKSHLATAKADVEKHYSGTCSAYTDFRELCARKDIDAVSMATPDHWHAVTAITALKSGKDVYGEKPLSHCLAEGRSIVETQKRYARVWQTGSWQRSQAHFRQACELVRNGRIGKVVRVEVGLPTGSPSGPVQFKDPPPELDYEFWLGPSRYAPYCDLRTHWNWRWQLDFGGGQLMDWIGHHADIANWGMGWDSTGPVEIQGRGRYPEQGIWNAATEYRFTAKYDGGVEMIVGNATGSLRGGTRWIGQSGSWIWVDRGGIDASTKSLLSQAVGPDEVQFYRSPGHQREFLDCVRSRHLTLCPAETAHRAASIGHLGQIAMLLGRKIRFNPQTEDILEDASASSMLSTPMRSPWRI